MGQKVNPQGFRVGINRGWNAQWTAGKKDFAKFVKEDNDIRKLLKKAHKDAAISTIKIERTNGTVALNIFTGRPGVLIGVKGAGIETLKTELSKLTASRITINIKEVKNLDLDATLVAESIAAQIEKRVSYKRAVKQSIAKAMKAGARGIKIMVGGRLDGAEIARSEFYKEGSLPLQTLRSNIEYGTATARTTAGAIGLKVWIYFGEILGKTTLVDSTAAKNEKGGN